MWVPIKLSDIGSIAKLRFSQTMRRMTTPRIRCGFATISVKKIDEDKGRKYRWCRQNLLMLFSATELNFRLGLQPRDVVWTIRKWQHSIFWVMAPQVERNFFLCSDWVCTIAFYFIFKWNSHCTRYRLSCSLRY